MHQDDRRAFLRVVAEFPVGWSRIGEDGQTQLPQHQASTMNVSAGGVKMVSEEPVAVGDRLRIEVRFSRPPLIVFTDASVVRVDSVRPGRFECGLRFDPLDTYIEQRVVRWVYAEDRRMAERRAACACRCRSW
jgi:c-di-GMP-binding flagellar brake protein YcgR